jgi:zinc transport system substrate-binding protein
MINARCNGKETVMTPGSIAGIVPGRTLRFLAGLVASLLLGASFGCEKNPNPVGKQSGTPARLKQVYVTNYPLEYFARRLAGSTAEVHFPMATDGDPAFWQPDAAMIARYQSADAIFINGATYEKWLTSATLPESRIWDTSAPFRDKLVQIALAETHSHGPEGAHSHAGTAFTTWIDFDQAAQQARTIKIALDKLSPDQAAETEANLAALLVDLKQLDEQMHQVSQQIGDRPLVASHPVYDYWARRYSLNVQSVLWEPDGVPSPEAIDELKKLLDGHSAKVMVWEDQPLVESRETLKTLGLESVVFNPCGNRPESGDWLSIMRDNVAALAGWAQNQ